MVVVSDAVASGGLVVCRLAVPWMTIVQMSYGETATGECACVLGGGIFFLSLSRSKTYEICGGELSETRAHGGAT